MVDYEKKYKEVLKKIREGLQPSPDGTKISGVTREFLEEVFPELKESEDERFRKYILKCCEETIQAYDRGLELSMDTTKKLKSWLEKQESVGEIVERCKNSWYNEGKIDGMAEGLTEDEKYQQGWHDALEKQSSSSVKWQKNTPENKPAINHSVLMKTTHGVAEGYFVGSLWFQFRWSSNIKDSDVLAWMELSDLDAQGEQKPTDKVESNFKVGDWVVCDATGSIYQIKTCIENLSNHRYGYDLTNGGYIGSDDGNHYHLWTIQDAKDGDVLAEDTCIFIIQKLGDNSTAAKTYCTLYDDGDFDDGSILYFDIDSTKPATKEQRDLLFSKMKEADYEFDFEKKELKKIGQKLTELAKGEDYGKCWKPSIDVDTMVEEYVKQYAYIDMRSCDSIRKVYREGILNTLDKINK